MGMVGKLVPVVLLVFLFMIGMTYSIGIMSSADDNMNVSAEYRDQYNQSVSVQAGTFNIMGAVGILLGIFALVIVLVGVYKGR